MWSRETWNKIMRWLRKVRMNRRSKRAWRTVHYAKPELEWLTPRIVPANNACIFLGPAGGGPGAWDVAANWQGNVMPDDTGSDTATIAAGAACVLDQADEVKIAGLTVNGSLTTRSLLTVQTTSLSGSGSTAVAAGGLLDVATPDVSGNTSTLETDTLTTAGGGGAVNLSIDPSAEVEINLSALIFGMTTVTGLLDAKNIDAFNGASVTLAGPGTVGGTGQLEAGINAGIIFAPSSTWVIGPGNPVGSAFKDGQFYVNGPLTVATAFDPDGDINLNDDGGATTLGSITGTGSLDEWNGFNWNGGLLSLAGGVTIEPQAEWKLIGPNPDTLGCSVTSNNLDVQFGGGGGLTITAGNTFTNASGNVDVSLPSIGGGGTFVNAAGATVNISSSAPGGLTIASILDNEGTIDCETGAGPLTQSDTSGGSKLNGKLSLNNDSLTISGIYTTTVGFDEDWSPSDLTTLTGMLTVAQGASADFDHMVITGGATVTGPGDFSIGANGGNTGDYLTWSGGTMSGTGTTTIGPYATLSIAGGTSSGDTLDSRTLDNHGLFSWAGALTIADSSGNGGPTIHNESDGTVDYEDTSGLSGTVSTFINDGMLEVVAGPPLLVGTFTQSSTGTLQSDIQGGPAFGAVSASGTATLDGTVKANLEDGYQPPSGTTFAVLTFASSSGQFADVEPDGWTATYDPTDVTLVSP